MAPIAGVASSVILRSTPAWTSGCSAAAVRRRFLPRTVAGELAFRRDDPTRQTQQRPLSGYINRAHRRANHGRAEWWAERTFRFGCDNQAILSYEIVTPFQMNQYLLGCVKTGIGALIDTGDAHASLSAAKNFGFDIKLLLQTHAHIDHIAGLAEIKEMPEYVDVPIYLHPGDLPWYSAAEKQSAIFGIPLRQPPPHDGDLADGQRLSVGAIELEVMHLPGHCPGHVAFHCEEHGFVVSGDVLFAGSVGRTDFPMSDHKAMMASLRRLMELPDKTRVFAGHMQPTTIGKERRSNPFVLQALGGG